MPKRKKRPSKASSIRKTAGALGIHADTFRDWLGQGAPGKTARGDYDLEAIKRWRQENLAPSRNGVEQDSKSSTAGRRLKRAQAREREAKAQLAELELATRRGDLIPLGGLKRGLLGLSEKLAPVLEGLTVGEIRAAIRHAVEEIL